MDFREFFGAVCNSTRDYPAASRDNLYAYPIQRTLHEFDRRIIQKEFM